MKWKTEIKRGVGIKRATLFLENARNSIGLKEGCTLADYEIKLLVEEYELYNSKIEELNLKLKNCY